MATPALRAFRSFFQDAAITCLGSAFTRQILSSSGFFNEWLVPEKSFIKTCGLIRAGHFDSCILLKNSFGCALSTRLCGIKRRIGYRRDGRSFLLTDKIDPRRSEDGQFLPGPMVNYYLRIAECMGAKIDNKKTELSATPEDLDSVSAKLGVLKSDTGPLVIVVPGGAFGPSKLWPPRRYAGLADQLAQTYRARVIISVAPVKEEVDIADSICQSADSNPVNLGLTALTGGELKALYSIADLVITNDTGPRHIAIALDKPVVSLFGPNNPQWTQTGHHKEIQIIGGGPCVPCDKPVCRQNRHLCMESITTEQVLDAATQFLRAQ
jgi:heptosyltransferase-2